MTEKYPITSVTEIKQRLIQGWELWYVAHKNQLPGHWEMRRAREKTIRVHWDPILRIQRNPEWFAANTTEIESGRSWCYRHVQAAIPLEASA